MCYNKTITYMEIYMDYKNWKKDDFECITLSSLLMEKANEFKTALLKCVELSPNPEISDLINIHNMERCENIIKSICEKVKQISNRVLNSDTGDSAVEFETWILLGSMTEFALQSFLSIYFDDYQNTKWQQWEDFNKDEVLKHIKDTLNVLVEKDVISSNQKKSIVENANQHIKTHIKEHRVENISLEELIQLYNHIQVLKDDEIKMLRIIQINRNCIHSFKSREIGDYNELMRCVYFYICLLDILIQGLPDCDCYDDYCIVL